jgi:hypothetical protein
MQDSVTHKQIYERLIAVEGKVNSIDTNTKDLVQAIHAAQGAMKVLGWIASLAKPVLLISAAFAAVTLFWSQLTNK